MLFNFLAVLVICFSFLACGDDDPVTDKNIIVSNQEQLTQSVFADDLKGNNDVNFTTKGAWTSSISESDTNDLRNTSLKSSRKSSPEWISITPDAGKEARDYTISINLTENLTGADRTAIITIVCGDTQITITITQKATKEDGTTPKEPDADEEIPQDLQNALTRFLEENNEIFITNNYKQYNYNISRWEEVQYVLAFNRNAKKLYAKGFINDKVTQYIEDKTVYTINGTKKQTFNVLTENIWNTNSISYYTKRTIELIGRVGIGLTKHVWTLSGNTYTGRYYHSDFVDEINFSLTNGKITAITSNRTQSSQAPYIYQNDISIGYSINPTTVANISKAEFTPIEQCNIKFIWGEGLGETTFFTGHEYGIDKSFGLYHEIYSTTLMSEDVKLFTPSLQGKTIVGYYSDADFTDGETYLHFFQDKPLYVSDNTTEIYVKWGNE